MLTLLLGDTELELVPQTLTGHRQVVSAAQRIGAKTNEMLLDSSLHHAAMRTLHEGERRGRPDLVHLFLLTGLESILNHAGQLRLLVHTREDRLIQVDPTTRLVRNYNRFCGLVQQLFATGKVPPEKPLLTMESGWKLTDVVAAQRADRVLIMDEQTAATPPWKIFSPPDANKKVLALIGGFPSGRFRSPLPAAETIGLGPRPLTVWTVASELLVHYEQAANVAGAPAAEKTG